MKKIREPFTSDRKLNSNKASYTANKWLLAGAVIWVGRTWAVIWVGRGSMGVVIFTLPYLLGTQSHSACD